MTAQTRQVAVSCRGIGKSFGPVRAVAGVDLDLAGGQVHALVGENGAGKSTLSKIIGGVLRPDQGRMELAGRVYRPTGRRDAQQQGVRMVMQELNLIPTLTVAENMFLDALPTRLGLVDRRRLQDRAFGVLERIGLTWIDAASPVERLGVGARQLVEIAAGLSRPCRVLILDEPTASLTDRESELLFEQIRRLTRQQVAVLYISHRIEEIRRIADVVTVLRDGAIVGTWPIEDISNEQIVDRMVGRHVAADTLPRTHTPGPVALRVEGLSVGPRVRDVSFELRRGEILGFAGLVGAGRTETLRAIFGADRPTAGRVYLRGSTVPVNLGSPRRAMHKGIALVPEDRKMQGLLLPLSVRTNTVLAAMDRVSTLGWTCPSAEHRAATTMIERLRIRCHGPGQPVETLSGGNQQKVMVAKWLFRDAEILLFDEPTRGIDVGARFDLYGLILELARQNRAILVASSDLKELMLLCDRIAVFSAGRLVEVFDRSAFSEQAINAAAFSAYVDQYEAAGGPDSLTRDTE